MNLEDELMLSRVEAPPLFSMSDATTIPDASPRSGPRSVPLDARTGASAHPSGLGAVDRVFRELARARLGRSATRVEALLDAAADEGLTVSETVARVAQLSIRGVRPATMRALADRLQAAADAAGVRSADG